MMVAAHADQIGLVVTYVDEHGYVFVEKSAAWTRLLPGRDLVIHGASGPVHAVVAPAAPSIPANERDKAPALHEQYLDVGAPDRAAALARIAIGDPITFASAFIELSPGVYATQAVDDRAGVYGLPRPRAYAAAPGVARLTALSTVTRRPRPWAPRRRRCGSRRTSWLSWTATSAATPRRPTPRAAGEVKLGAGPVLGRGAGSNHRLLRSPSRWPRRGDRGPGQGRAGGHDHRRRRAHGGGRAATLSLSLPVRYMHSPFEVAHGDDLEAAARLCRPRAAPGRRGARVVRPSSSRPPPCPGRPVKLFIAIDLEGISGVVADATPSAPAPPPACARAPAGRPGRRGRGMPRRRGRASRGVRRARRRRNLERGGLPAEVLLVGGSPTPRSMLQGIDAGYDAALFVGYHASAGTAGAVLEHTWNYDVFSVSFGDLEVGELGLDALLAGHVGVPAVYLSGDDKAAAEARRWCRASRPRWSRRGIARLAARLLPPEPARARRG